MNSSENNIIKIEKKMEKFKKSMNLIGKDLINLKKRIKKLEIDKGAKNIIDFEIKTKEQWDTVERNLTKTGIILEYEVFKKLKEMEVDFEQNFTFFYPNEANTFYLDYVFSKNGSFLKFKDGPEINIAENEIDALITQRLEFKEGKYKIKVFVHYLIECKSRNDPPINYLFIPNKHFKKFNEDQKSVLKLYGSTFFGVLYLKNDYLWPTLRDPISINHSNLSIDPKDTITDAFWQLFKCIDHESNLEYTYNLFSPFSSTENSYD